ncbi:ABC transporter ATPase [Lutibacter sp.]|uniref:ABC transporter ATPase n=1 Tax=Lutibacter sp. TaxID=1925666 RepID=UPI001A30B13E|nr:ABC transporter ATPase [Lutibacter sp.]MBI9040054.1 ABC transporter ATPase [Lutibacter sp.]
MIVGFSTIPEESKIWVFPSNRKFYPQETEEITTKLETFLSSWKSDRNEIECSYLIKHDRFILVTANDTENSVSLEAHDALTSFIIELEKKFEIVLLDKINVCYKQGEFVQYKDIIEFKKMIKSKGVSEKTIVFNNMITIKEELRYNWEINIMESWLGRLVKK